MNINKILQEFSTPSVVYRGKPFWAWNGELKGDELVRQAHIMKEMGLGGYFMHARAGLITEYLGEEWFELINQVADAAEADGMEAWLYDEDRWPSGSAGGKVTVDPQYRMKSLYVFETTPDLVTWDAQSIALYVAKMDGVDMWAYEELDIDDSTVSGCASHLDIITHKIQAAIDRISPSVEDKPGVWKILRFAIVPDPCHSNYNGTTYIDTMNRKATDRFIELTHEEYAKHCGDRLGRSIKGIFTDEPHRGHCMENYYKKDGALICAMCWTDDIFEEFEKRYGYSCRSIIPELFYRKNGEKVAPVKLHYIDLANQLFIERFAMPINEWCKNHGMIFTGHVLNEDNLLNQTERQGSLMRFYEHMGYPGVDVLGEHGRNYWIVKQLTSVGRQLGQKWLLSELYGCTGWQFDFKAHKAVGDWQALFGINVRCQHLSWYTMEGEAKRDCPASILHQSPWYKDYNKVEDHFARMGVVLSEGEAACDVLVLNPIESAWCQAYVGWIYKRSPDVVPYEVRYGQLFHFLAGNQIDFDYGEEEMMSRLASVEISNGVPVMRIGHQIYKTVIVSNMLTIRATTLALLRKFMDLGGKVIFCGDVPEYVDAVKSDEPSKLAERVPLIPFDEAALVSMVREYSAEYVEVTNIEGKNEEVVFAQVRRNFGDDGYAVVVLNTDRAYPRKNLTLALRAPAGYAVEEWDLDTGMRYNVDSKVHEEDGVYYINMDLVAAGTRCFVLTKDKNDKLPVLVDYETIATETLRGEFPYTCSEPNVCVLDWCKWRWKDGEWHNEDEVLRVDRQIRSDLGIPWRASDMLQPWYAKTYDQTEYGALQLSYEFYIDKLPTGDVYLAGERSELNHYRINGVSLCSEENEGFWVDDCFNKMKIPANTLKLGLNEVTIDVTFLRTTNVEAIYLIGRFGVRISGRKCTLVEMPPLMGCENYVAYDMPFYTGELTFTLTADDYANMLGDVAQSADRIVLTPVEWTGGCVKITAAGKTTVLGWDPYEADVTEAYRQGAPISVTIVGTRVNVFGPLHQIPKPASSCGNLDFVTAGAQWTDDYSLMNSGLRGFAFKVQKKT